MSYENAAKLNGPPIMTHDASTDATLFKKYDNQSMGDRPKRPLNLTDGSSELPMPMNCEQYNPRMLTLAREANRLTQTALAEEMAVSQPLVARWESTTDSATCPDREQATRLAEILGVAPVLFAVEPPQRPEYGGEFYHRARAKAKRGEIKAIHARCAMFEIQVDRLLDGVELPEGRIPDIDPDNHVGDVEKVAGMARLQMGVPSGPVDNLVDVIESCGGLVIDRGLEASDMSALCRWVPGLPKLFYLNGNEPGDRMRLLLAHELGHTVMHFGRDVEFKLAENQANRFAGAFLMPASEVRRDFGRRLDLPRLAQLKRKWRVSMQALAYRAHQLGCIDATRFKSIFTQMSRQGIRKTEPVPITRESPLGFKRLVRRHLEAGYSQQQLAELLLLSSARLHEVLVDNASPDVQEEGVRLRLAR